MQVDLPALFVQRIDAREPREELSTACITASVGWRRRPTDKYALRSAYASGFRRFPIGRGCLSVGRSAGRRLQQLGTVPAASDRLPTVASLRRTVGRGRSGKHCDARRTEWNAIVIDRTSSGKTMTQSSRRQNDTMRSQRGHVECLSLTAMHVNVHGQTQSRLALFNAQYTPPTRHADATQLSS